MRYTLLSIPLNLNVASTQYEIIIAAEIISLKLPKPTFVYVVYNTQSSKCNCHIHTEHISSTN